MCVFVHSFLGNSSIILLFPCVFLESGRTGRSTCLNDETEECFGEHMLPIGREHSVTRYCRHWLCVMTNFKSAVRIALFLLTRFGCFCFKEDCKGGKKNKEEKLREQACQKVSMLTDQI